MKEFLYSYEYRFLSVLGLRSLILVSVMLCAVICDRYHKSRDLELRTCCNNVSSTKAKNGKNRLAILTIFRHLRRAKHAANGYIELTLIH
ncbi:hypothetical protein VB774_04330 [Pseudanabaena galeata UHCC 0370]|uniref:Transposase n=1 Tax=Pseudanabaena galeata UHCC 0370 TaxID=3110310 RepID=A0ABU5TFI9_9CYAN|nr:MULTISPECIES: hypothetical protein [Pseudanabaena]MEA5476841.1 hypothetical protein [Pseudanabaena galeata UHCC 0370]MEA5488788.1 hypothetical protein [Pseudanabaena sp. CCNP1317]WGS71256.1 hypothetical protein OA858_16240 [Pseudanabaena galeata CCNP1313]